MKKVFLATAILLVAAGCHRGSQTQPATNGQNQQSDAPQTPQYFTQNGITITQPSPGDTVSSPFDIKGYGLPPFEGVAGHAELLDSKGTVLGQAQLTGDSANPQQPYNYQGSLTFTNPSGSGYVGVTLRILSDNPSGIPQNQRTIDVPLQVNLPK